MTRLLVVGALCIALATSGCLGFFKKADKDTDAQTVDPNISRETTAQIEEVATGLYRNWTFPGQAALPRAVAWLNGTITGGGQPGLEDRNDRSGNNYNTKIIASDVGSLAPAGQPVELRIKLWFFAKLGSAADLDIYVDVPGIRSEYAEDSDDEFNWKVSVQEITINTMRIDGRPFDVGVQVSNEWDMAEPLDYFLQVTADFEEGVIAPQVPYAITVPEGAKGLIVSSAKAGGSEHIRGQVLIIGPDDELVAFVPYNDIGLATESKLLPIAGPGEYVVYALNLTGGFIRVSTDVPVPPEMRPVRILERVETAAVDLNQPAPGVVARSYTVYDPALGTVPITAATPFTPGATTSFTVAGTFPLEIRGYIGGEGQEFRGASQIRISGPLGLVHDFQRVVQYQDERGTIGHSRDELNTVEQFQNLAKGAYNVEIVNDGPTEIGHIVVTYKR